MSSKSFLNVIEKMEEYTMILVHKDANGVEQKVTITPKEKKNKNREAPVGPGLSRFWRETFSLDSYCPPQQAINVEDKSQVTCEPVK